jgi:hypothetical protein
VRAEAGTAGAARRLLAGVVIAIGGACIDLSTDPDEIVAIEFAELPWPSVAAGDTLRDSLGALAPLVARLFDGAGRPVPGGVVEFISRDTTVTILAGNLVFGRDAADGPARLLASGPGVQSIVRSLEVVPPPDSIAAEGTIDTLRWVLPDVPATNVSGELRVKLLSRGATTTRAVRSWIVSYDLEFQGAPVDPGDTSRVWLVGETGRPSRADTTDAQGIGARRVRVRGGPGLPAGVDSVIVIVHARHRGASVTGAPIRLVLPIRPR